MAIAIENIEMAANSTRKKLGIFNVFAPDLEMVLEKVKKTAKRFDYKIVLSKDLGSDEAIYDDNTNTLSVRESVFCDLQAGKPRARFTIAHELGHYILGHDGIRRRNPDKFLYVDAKERAEESEADLFASYFLVPTELALDLDTAQDISDRFQVSMPMAEIAFARVSSVKRKKKGEYRRPPQGVIDFLQEARKKGYEVRSTIDGFE
jgi:Zn-dependent peptidase ImmA (M78 family)